jgi:anti-anti-sigma factor
MSHVKHETINHWLVIRFTDARLTDPLTVSDTAEQLTKLVEPLPERCRVAISFAGVEFVSSQVIGMMLGLKDQVRRKHGELVLCKPGKHVLDVMKITRLDRQFTFSDSLSAIVGPRKSRSRATADVEWMD